MYRVPEAKRPIGMGLGWSKLALGLCLVLFLVGGGTWLSVLLSGNEPSREGTAASGSSNVPFSGDEALRRKTSDRSDPAFPPSPSIRIAKWYDDHSAAISVTYDGFVDTEESRRVQRFVVELGSHLDYELTTATLTPRRTRHIADSMVPQGFQFFGHGHEHIWHDRLSYEAALGSFRTNYEIMAELGLKPVAYAYPYGAGEKTTTRRALADSGFLSGRLFERYLSDPYLVPGDELAPSDWFGLPTLVMMNEHAFSFASDFINDTQELTPYLDEAVRRRAWLITTYHNIGNESGWGFYEMDDFEQDLRAIADRDFWVASFNDVTLYLRQREKARASAKWVVGNAAGDLELEIRLDDGLANDRYVQPLTLVVETADVWADLELGAFQAGQLVAKAAAAHDKLMISLVPNEIPYRVRELQDISGSP